MNKCHEGDHKAIEVSHKVIDELQKLNATLQAANDKLEERDRFLDALEAAGVDNWEGYDEAIEILNESKDN